VEELQQMTVLQTMLSVGGGGIAEQIAKQFGISPTQATAALSALLPALAGGLRETMETGAAREIANMIGDPNLAQFADSPASLASPAALNQGNALLSAVFGFEDTSYLVSMVAEKVGVSRSAVASILPVAATLLGAFLAKDTAAGGNPSDTLEHIASGGRNGLIDAVKGLASRILK
jgi:hypothetical protein